VRLATILSKGGRDADAKEVIRLAQRYEKKLPRGDDLLEMLSLRATAHFRIKDDVGAHQVVRKYLQNGGERDKLHELKVRAP
jgi:hypothetical protein